MALGNFIKKLIEVGAIFGVKSKKLAGINDAANKMVADNAIFDNATNTIIVPNVTTVPTWLVNGKYFRTYTGGYKTSANLNIPYTVNPATNEFQLFRVDTASVVGPNLVINVDPGTNSPATGIFSVKLDARLALAHNNPTISRLTDAGGTMFNVLNNTTTGLPDGSGVALASTPHYHSLTDHDLQYIGNNIVTHEMNSLGNPHYTNDIPTANLVRLGPLVVVDNNGDVVLGGGG